MKKILISFIALFACVALINAQGKPAIEFDEIVHDYGTFPEENGKVTCQFKFKNTGDADLILQKVRASCGCTTPNWTKTPVKPGETGTIDVTYNASGRPGAFTKTITVTSNAGEKRLSIKGDVIPKAQKVEDKYPFDMQGLRFMKQNLYFNTVFVPGTKEQRVDVINNSKEDIKVSFQDVPSFVTVKCEPEVLTPNQKGIVTVSVNTKDSNVWGSFKKNFKVAVNGKVGEQNQINIYGNVQENFSKMTAEEKANAPVMIVGNKVTLGNVKVGASKTFKFSVKNEGKSNLIIRAINSDSQSFIVTAPSKEIKPGKSADIRVKVDAAKMKAGKYTQKLTIISNDPNRSSYIVELNGIVE